MDERRQAASAALARLVKLRWFRRARRIALYSPAGGELDPALSPGSSALNGKQVYLPVVAARYKSRLRFSRWTNDTQWQRNRHNIQEPRVRLPALLRPQEMDLVIVPLVGFDEHCNRLGAGGGYYDRSFAFRHHRATWRRPRLVGLAFECQHVENIQTQPWDVSLDAVVTNCRLHLR